MASLSTLPPEMFDAIYQIVLDNCTMKKDFSSLTLVARKWYLPARKESIKNYYSTASKDLDIIVGMIQSNAVLATCFEQVNLFFIQGSTFTSFFTFISILPNLKSLQLRRTENIMQRLKKNQKFPIFPSLTTLDLAFDKVENGNDLVCQFLNPAISPKLLNCSFSLPDFECQFDFSSSTVKHAVYHQVERLSIFRTGELAVVLKHYPSLRRLLNSSFLNLNHLSLDCSITPELLLDVITLAGPTLKSFRLHMNNSFTSNEIFELLPHFSQLIEFTLSDEPECLNDPLELGINFLQHIPSSMKKLAIFPLSSSHLAHLQSHPRPSLQLRHISIDQMFNSEDIFNYLPKSLTSVLLEPSWHEVFQLKDVLKIMKKEKKNINLKEIQITSASDLPHGGDIDEENDGDSREKWIKKFGEIGIKVYYTEPLDY